MALFLSMHGKKNELANNPNVYDVLITYEGEVMIDLGENPPSYVVAEAEKIAKRYEKEKISHVYVVQANDHFLALWKLSLTLLDVVVDEKDIGKFNVFQLVSMKVATRIS